jgi:exocyst complex component 4
VTELNRVRSCDDRYAQGNYTTDREAAEPDPHIIDLNTELGQCDDFVSAALPKRKQQYASTIFLINLNDPTCIRYVFVGLGQLMEQQLISNARYIRLANAFGVKKILRNIIALQQGIRTITNEPQPRDLDHARRYYSLFFISPQVRICVLLRFDSMTTFIFLPIGDAGWRTQKATVYV